MASQGILPGYDLGQDHDDMANCLLVSVTEKKSANDLERFIEVLAGSLEAMV
jgi:hypothetical protein